MRNFILGFILGIVISTIGFTGLARFLDRGINKVKEIAREIQ